MAEFRRERRRGAVLQLGHNRRSQGRALQPSRHRAARDGGEPGVRIRLHRVRRDHRSEEHTSELQSLMRTSYAVFCLKKKSMTPIPLPSEYLRKLETQPILLTSRLLKPT